MLHSQPPAPRRLGVLDGLRGIAVLLVLWYHVWEISFLRAPAGWLQFVPETGFVGVTLFFFLSGFVIVYPFVRAEAQASAGPGWSEFAWRRFAKIVPSYVLCIAVAYALGYAQRQPGASLGWDLLTHLLFVHTWFAQTYGTISGVLWTLAVEVQFYLAFPLLWWAFRRWPWLVAAAMIGAAWGWRAAWAGCCLTTYFPFFEENLPGYLDIFAFGMLSAYVYVRWVRGNAKLTTAGLLVSLAGSAAFIALLQGLYAYRFAPQWSGIWQIDGRPFLGASFAAVALGFLAAPRWWQLLLDNPSLRFLAAISYNLYLYHQMVARELLAWRVPRFSGDPHYDPEWQVAYTQVVFVVTIAQATLVTYAFERPVMRRLLRGHVPPPARALSGACTDPNAATVCSKPPSG